MEESVRSRSLQARRHRSARRKATFIVLTVLLQAAYSFLFGRNARSVWMYVRSSTWWDDVVLNRFSPRDWRENFRVSKATFDYLCHNLQPLIQKADANMRRPVLVEQRVAVTLWILATPSEYRSVAHLFGKARCTVCQIVHKTC